WWRLTTSEACRCRCRARRGRCWRRCRVRERGGVGYAPGTCQVRLGYVSGATRVRVGYESRTHPTLIRAAVRRVARPSTVRRTALDTRSVARLAWIRAPRTPDAASATPEILPTHTRDSCTTDSPRGRGRCGRGCGSSRRNGCS